MAASINRCGCQANAVLSSLTVAGTVVTINTKGAGPPEAGPPRYLWSTECPMVEQTEHQRADMDKIVSLCKRRGFVFPSAEIYGGFANTYDYGPLGVLLKNNVRDAWIRAIVQRRDDMELLDAALITSPRVWVASGHVKEFNDPLVQCLGECKRRYRADQIDTTVCPNCGGPLGEAQLFNTMFKTQVGPVPDEDNIAYLPPETAQGMFVNFVNVATTMRRKL